MPRLALGFGGSGPLPRLRRTTGPLLLQICLRPALAPWDEPPGSVPLGSSSHSTGPLAGQTLCRRTWGPLLHLGRTIPFFRHNLHQFKFPFLQLPAAQPSSTMFQALGPAVPAWDRSIRAAGRPLGVHQVIFFWHCSIGKITKNPRLLF